MNWAGDRIRARRCRIELFGSSDEWEGDSRLNVPGLSGAFRNLLAETGFLETDFGLFELGRETAGFETLLGFFDSSLGAPNIDIFRLFCNLSHDSDFGGRHFGKTPEHRHVVGLIAYAIAKFADAQGRQKMAMTGQDAELAF